MDKEVKLYKGGEVVKTLSVGVYSTSELEGMEKVEIPEKIGFMLLGDPSDYNAMALYENETYDVDAKAGKYERLLVLDLEGSDLRLLKMRDQELSDDELLAVVGGAGEDGNAEPIRTCVINACGAEGCGAQA